jgi:hypothetical protein
MAKSRGLTVADEVDALILTLRGNKVILDADLAKLYGVSTSRLNEQVRRNVERFPDDFMVRLTSKERDECLNSHPRLSRLKHSTVVPCAFTEHGAIMAASVLNSPRAVEASIFVVRAFVKLRQILATHKELAQKLALLERKLGDHDEAIVAIMDAIKQLMEPPPAPSKPRIGFR